MIQNIDVNKIWPHKDNPRKDLGDLTELAASIKSRGILQNLTVVPLIGNITNEVTEGCYTAVIGHRRLAAAKLAGLTEVPCIITDMDQKMQLATMLLENIQRSDLTVYEQAQGFQMMISLGESVNRISEQTGFSESTVRHRVKLMELDQKELQEAVVRGGTLMDYAELEKIKDIKLKNKVLKTIGTTDFKWKLKNAVEEEMRPERKAELLKILETFATKTKDQGGMSYEKYFGNFNMDGWKKPNDANTAEYFYVINNDYISLYKKVEKVEQSKQATAAEKAFKKKESQLKDLTRRAYESRYEFVINFGGAKKQLKDIMTLAMERMLCYGRAEPDEFLKILGVEKPAINGETSLSYHENEKLIRSLILEKYEEQPERVLFLAAYLTYNDKKSTGYVSSQSWCNKIEHSKNKDLDMIYDSLIRIGYEMSNEEKQLQDGTHELFKGI